MVWRATPGQTPPSASGCGPLRPVQAACVILGRATEWQAASASARRLIIVLRLRDVCSCNSCFYASRAARCNAHMPVEAGGRARPARVVQMTWGCVERFRRAARFHCDSRRQLLFSIRCPGRSKWSAGERLITAELLEAPGENRGRTMALASFTVADLPTSHLHHCLYVKALKQTVTVAPASVLRLVGTRCTSPDASLAAPLISILESF